MDFVRDYMRALLAKEIDVAAELQKQKSQVVYQQYGVGGGTLNRGYYCPSLTRDLWLGNAKRGRLCKKRPPEEKLTYIYGFDESDRLVVVDHLRCPKEYILYGSGMTLGVSVDRDKAIDINICRYDVSGRIQIYENYFLTPKADQVFNMTRETFRYLPDQVINNWYRETEIEGHWVHEHHRYVFSVKDGYLGDYTAENFYHGRCGVKIPYRVTKKRKVPPCK